MSRLAAIVAALMAILLSEFFFDKIGPFLFPDSGPFAFFENAYGLLTSTDTPKEAITMVFLVYPFCWMICFFLLVKIFCFTLRKWYPKHVIFTDPAIMGFTPTGDVDDHAAALLACQQWKKNAVFIICDEKTYDRYQLFMEQVGDELHELYGSTFIMEKDLSSDILENAILHIHAPVTEDTAQCIMNARFSHLYSQGNNNKAVNFKSDGGKQLFAFILEDPRTTMFSTDDTNFTLKKDDEFLENLDTELCKKMYQSFFDFQQRKTFGLAAHLSFLVNRLYSDEDGPDGGYGNGIKPFVPLLPKDSNGNLCFNVEVTLSDVLSNACDLTIAENAKPSARRNIRFIVHCLNMYTDFESLLVDGKLPNMSNLREVIPREEIPEEVRSLIEAPTSTPLFDFAALAFSIHGMMSKEELRKMVESTLLE